MTPQTTPDGPYPTVRRTLNLGIVGLAEAGKTEFVLSFAAIHKDSIPGWQIIRVGDGLQHFMENRVNYGRTAATDVLESRFKDMSLLLLRSRAPIDGAIIQLELRASDYAGEVFADLAALTERFKEEEELQKWKLVHAPGLRSWLATCDVVLFLHHCMAFGGNAGQLNYTLLLSKLANERKEGSLPLIMGVSRADELANKLGDEASLDRQVADTLLASAAEPCDPSQYEAKMNGSMRTAMAVLDARFPDLRRAMNGPGLNPKALLLSSWGYRAGAGPIVASLRPNPLQPQGVHFVIDQAIQNRLPALREELRIERENEARKAREAADLARRRGYRVAVTLILMAMVAGVFIELYRNTLPR